MVRRENFVCDGNGISAEVWSLGGLRPPKTTNNILQIHVQIHMTSKTISIKEEAYKRLKRLKKDDKSFSDVILELTEKSKKDFSDVIGAELDVKWKEIKRSRKRSEEDKEREELLFGH